MKKLLTFTAWFFGLLSLHAQVQPATQISYSEEVRWGGQNGVEIIEKGEVDRPIILRNDQPVPAEQVARGKGYLQVFSPGGEVDFEASLQQGEIAWVWDPAYGTYGGQVQLAGLQPASVARADARLGMDPSAGGFWVKEVQAGSPAARSGLQPYDQVIAIVGQPQATPVSLKRALSDGRTQLTVLREGQPLSLWLDARL